MKTLITGVGSILGGILASACCIGPLLAVGLGIGGLGAATALEAYRPYILGGTFACLGVAYYFTYRGTGKCAEDEACEVETSLRFQKIALFVATLLTVGFSAFPYFL